jgi:hypothetical protein
MPEIGRISKRRLVPSTFGTEADPMRVDTRLPTAGGAPAVPDAKPRGPVQRLLVVVATAAIVVLSSTGFALLTVAEQPERAGRSSIDDYLIQDAAVAKAEPSRIKYLTPDREVPINNGGTVALSEELNLTVSVRPYPPTTFNIDVDLLLTDASGAPVDGATVTSEWDMVFMWHGPFDAEFQPLGDGRYTAAFHFFMVGPWKLVTRVTAPGYQEPDPLSLFIYIWPE